MDQRRGGAGHSLSDGDRPEGRQADLRERGAARGECAAPAGYRPERRSAEPGEAGGRRPDNQWLALCLPAFATKALGAAAPDFVFSALKSGEIDSLKQKFPILSLQTGAELLRSDAIRDELGLLSAPDRKRFEQMIETFITDNGSVMSASLDAQIAAGAGTQPPTIPEADRAKQARQAFDQAMQRFIVLCNAAAGTP